MRNWLKHLFSASENPASAPVDSAPLAAAPLPNSDDAANLKEKGDAYLRNGDFAEAAQYYRQAIALNPDNAKAHNNLGFVLNEQGLFTESEACLERALAIDPTIADAHYILGTLSQTQGQLDIACMHFRKALALAPDFEFAYRDLCFVLFQQGQLDDAKQVAVDGIALNPQFADLHFYLGNLHHEQKQFDLAIDSYQMALALQPDRQDILSNLGLVLLNKDLPDQAATVLHKALALAPNLANAHNLLGNALHAQNKFDEAIESYRTALKIDSKLPDAHYYLGNVLRDCGRLGDAEASYRRALQDKPDFAEAHNNLGNVLCDLGRADAAAASYRRALQITPDLFKAHDSLLFACNYIADRPRAEILADARRFGNLAQQKARPYAIWSNRPAIDRRLRVGLVSGDFRNHPVGYFAESVLTALFSYSSERLEIVAYSNHSSSDELTERIKNCCHQWHSVVALSDEDLAARIRDDGIDILIDLSGHTSHNRLPMFAWKPAPVQVTWLGYVATTGVEAIDYLIADPWTLPANEEANFTETIWRLPETRLCFTPPTADIPISLPHAAVNHHIIFGCLNNLAKVNDAVIALWARILHAIPDSKLLLKANSLDLSEVQQRLTTRFATHGINSMRLILEGYSSRSDYLSTYHRVDIALDPFPYTGGTTTVEALWMGVPVLTLAGKSFLARQGVGLLMNAGLPDWIAADADDYVARAVYHAGDMQRLAALRSGLRQQVLDSPIFDAMSFARHFEAALRAMWTQWCGRQRKQLPT